MPCQAETAAAPPQRVFPRGSRFLHSVRQGVCDLDVPVCVFTIQHGSVDVVNCLALNGVVVSHRAVQELVLWHVAVVLHVFSMLSHCMLLCPKHASVM
jgi:hypothetical protein